MLVCYRALRGHALRVETRFAEDRTSTFLDWARLERNLTLCTALGARSVEHLPVLHALILALVAAVLAPLRCGELLGGIKFLFTIGERERLTAIAAL
jgi:hypothetical protein